MDRAVLLLIASAYSGPYDLVIRAYPIWVMCTDHGGLVAVGRETLIRQRDFHDRTMWPQLTV